MTAQPDIQHKLNQLSPVFKDYDFLTKDFHPCAADRADVAFIFEKLSKLPDTFKRLIMNKASQIKQRRERNLHILRTSEKTLNFLPEKLRLLMTVEEDEIRSIANDCTERCRRIALQHNVASRVNPTSSEPLTLKGVNAISCDNSSR